MSEMAYGSFNSERTAKFQRPAFGSFRTIRPRFSWINSCSFSSVFSLRSSSGVFVSSLTSPDAGSLPSADEVVATLFGIGLGFGCFAVGPDSSGQINFAIPDDGGRPSFSLHGSFPFDVLFGIPVCRTLGLSDTIKRGTAELGPVVGVQVACEQACQNHRQ